MKISDEQFNDTRHSATPNPNSFATQHLVGNANNTTQKKILPHFSEHALRTGHNIHCTHERNRD